MIQLRSYKACGGMSLEGFGVSVVALATVGAIPIPAVLIN